MLREEMSKGQPEVKEESNSSLDLTPLLEEKAQTRLMRDIVPYTILQDSEFRPLLDQKENQVDDAMRDKVNRHLRQKSSALINLVEMSQKPLQPAKNT